MNFEMKLIEGKIKVVTGLHIGSGNTEMHIGGTDNPVIKNAVTNEPYIPGSSLKGKMRSLLRLYTGGDDSKEIVAKLFGISADDKTNKAENIGTARLSFWDCFLNGEWKKQMDDRQLLPTEVKMENTIDRVKGTALNPRNTERVLPSAEFDFKLTVKTYDGEDVLPVVLGVMKLLEMDALGGSGSRGYGKIKFENLTVDGKDIQADLDKIEPFKERFV